jgi:O-antigen/teichoic acid export membrane protein
MRRFAAFVGSAGSLRGQVVRGGAGGLALRGLSAILALALAVVLARTLGPDGYGTYAFALSLVTLLAAPAHMGLPTLLVREIARYQQRQQWGLLRGILIRSNQAALGLAVLIGLAAAGVALGPWGILEPPQLQTFAWALALLPLIAFGNLCGAALRGLRYVVQGLLPELLLRPGLLLGAVGVAALFGMLTPPLAMALHAAAAAMAFGIGALFLLRSLTPPIRESAPTFETRRWVGSLLPLSLLAGMQVINNRTGVVILGLLGATEEVGLYRIAVQGAAVVILGLTTINLVIAPHVAHLYDSGKRVQLQKMIGRSAGIVFLSAVPPAVLFIFFGDRVLEAVFGGPYIPAYRALALLSIGQLFSAAMGSAGLILNMTGHERDTVKVVAFTSVLNVALCVVLIPPFGINGAAAALTAALICKTLLFAVWAYQRTGLIPLAITAGFGPHR